MKQEYIIITEPTKVVAYLIHEATKTQIFVYKKIGWFQRVMIKFFWD